ncbi:MAG: hypothetical protein AAF495_28915 [Pseudomonadota bacterium]
MRAFDPDQAFRAFEAATNEKAVSAEILSALLRNTIATGRVLLGDGPLALYVPGIGEGLQAVGYAQSLHEITGRSIEIYSDEPSDDLAQSARQRLAALPFVTRVEISIGSAYAPEALAVERIDFAELSHMLYYVPAPDVVPHFAAKIVERLSPTGLASFLHNLPGSNFTQMMERYSPLVLPDPVPQVTQAAERLDLPLLALDYRVAMRVEAAARLKEIAPPFDALDGGLTQSARLVECLCQRSLEQLADLDLLAKALEDLGQRLDADGRMEIRDRVQLLPAPTLAADPRSLSQLEAAVARTAAEAPEIERRHPIPSAFDGPPAGA